MAHSTTNSTTTTSFLHLPLEVRQQIYDLSITPSRLGTRAVLDPEYLFSSSPPPNSGRRISPLLLTSRRIHHETVSIFYSRATLEVTPCQHDPTDSRGRSEFMTQYERDHAFVPARYLKLVQSVHVYGDQAWPVDQDAFQALFRWLVARTGVRCVYLSRKTMQQGRHIPELVSLDGLVCDGRDLFGRDEGRVIDVYARNVSSRLRFMEGNNCLLNRTKPWPEVQLYHFRQSNGGVRGCEPQVTLHREPRWEPLLKETRHNGCVGPPSVAVDKEVLLRHQMERFATGDLGDPFMKQAHVDGYLWLYKTIQIQQPVMDTTIIGGSAIRVDDSQREPVLVF